MNLKDRIAAIKSRPRDPNAVPLSSLAPMTKSDIDAAYAAAKAKMDAAMASGRREKVAA